MQDAWWLIDHKTKRMVEETLGLSGVLTFTVREKQPLHLTREQVATLSVDDFLQLWQVCTRVDRRSARAASSLPPSVPGSHLVLLTGVHYVA